MAKELLDRQGNQVKHNGKVVFESGLNGIVKQVDPAKRTLIMEGTNENQDRDGDIIEVKGWQMENYLNNPVFLWAHDYRSVPLAAASQLARKRLPHPHLSFTLKFAPEGIYPFADMIFELYKLKQINASSVGFIPMKWEKIDLDEEEKQRFFNPRRFKSQELLELSGCAVPSNPTALQNFIKSATIPKGLNSDLLFDYIVGKEMPPVDKSDDVFEEIEKIKKGIEFIDETTSSFQVPDQIKEGKEADLEEEIIDIEKDLALKPYPNEHACRIKNPDGYDRFRRQNCQRKVDGKCIDTIFGVKDDKTEVQALRYPKASWNVGAARSHCKSEKGTFEPAKESMSNIVDLAVEDGYVYLNDLVFDAKDLLPKLGIPGEMVELQSEGIENIENILEKKFQELLEHFSVVSDEIVERISTLIVEQKRNPESESSAEGQEDSKGLEDFYVSILGGDSLDTEGASGSTRESEGIQTGREERIKNLTMEVATLLNQLKRLEKK